MLRNVIICVMLSGLLSSVLKAQSGNTDIVKVNAVIQRAEQAKDKDLLTLALELYQEARNLVKEVQPLDTIHTKIHNGYLSVLGKSQAYREMIREQRRRIKWLVEANTKDYGGIYFLYGSIGSFYLSLEEGDSATQTFKQAVPYAQQSGKLVYLAAAQNNLGMGFMELGETDSAYTAFQTALTLLKKTDKEEIGLESSIRDNLGEYFLGEKIYNEAIENFQLNLSVSRLHERKGRILKSLLRLADAHLSKGEMELAADFLKEAQDPSLEKELAEPWPYESFLHISTRLAILSGNPDKAMESFSALTALLEKRSAEARQKADKALESLAQLKLKGVENLLESQENKLEEIDAQLNESQQETRTIYLLLFLVAGLAILIVIMLIILYRRRLGLQTKKSELKGVQAKLLQYEVKTKEMQSQQLQERLTLKDKDLTDLAIDISRRREWTEQILDELKKVRKSGGQISGDELRELIINIQGQIQADEKLKIFQQNIEQVNQEFFEKLLAKFPNLTKTEKELCGLIRLNLSSKEISNVRGVSPNSVKVGKHRLRKKLNLDPEDEIYTYLQQF